MRLVMLGTGPFAVPTLRALAASRHEVTLVVTRPSAGRVREACPMQQAGESLRLAVWSPESVNLPDSQERISALAPDLLVVCDYGEILRPDVLATAKLGGINLHGSLLPKFRGAAPVQWAILNGEAETGNSVIQMTPGLDAGPCLGQQHTPIDPDEDAGQLEARMAEMGAALVLSVIDDLEGGNAKPVVQNKNLTSKAPRLKKEQGAIDWQRSAQEIKNQVQGLRPWPRAFTFWHHEGAAPVRLNVDRVMLIDESKQSSASAPVGAIVDATSRLLVATGDGILEIIELQPAGKRSMSAAEFLRGNRVAAGDLFGLGG